MTVRIIPTLLANTKPEFDACLRKLLSASTEFQVDFMDGRLVQSVGVPLKSMPDFRRYKAKRFEAHLMVLHPERYLALVAKKGFVRVLFHYEALRGDKEQHLKQIVAMCKRLKLTPILAINPETPVRRILPYTKLVDGVLFLGVHPGFNGAPYVKATPRRIREFVMRNRRKRAPFIQVDGGMTPKTIAGVAAAGATRINSGSYVRNAPDPKRAVSALRAAGKSGRRKRQTRRRP